MVVKEPRIVGGIGEINFGKQYRQGNRVYDSQACAMALNSQPVGNAGGYSYLYLVKVKKALDMQNDNQIMPKQASKAVVCCKLNKMPEGHLTSLDDATVCDFYTPTASTVTSRYYKGLGAHKDNMVLEIWKRC